MIGSSPPALCPPTWPRPVRTGRGDPTGDSAPPARGSRLTNTPPPPAGSSRWAGSMTLRHDVTPTESRSPVLDLPATKSWITIDPSIPLASSGSPSIGSLPEVTHGRITDDGRSAVFLVRDGPREEAATPATTRGSPYARTASNSCATASRKSKPSIPRRVWPDDPSLSRLQDPAGRLAVVVIVIP